MNIREAGREVVGIGTERRDYLVGFNGHDETLLSAAGMDDLENLWLSLCPEFECDPDSVDYVERL